MWVSPFRYPRIIKYLLLPVAFRSLSRLSSALSAKASTLRSYQLNLLTLGAGLLPPSTSIALDAQVLVHNFGFFIVSNEVFRKIVRFSYIKIFDFYVTSIVLDVSIFYRFRSDQLIDLVIFGFQGTDLIQQSLHSQWTRRSSICFVTCFALCSNEILIVCEQARSADAFI